MKKNIRKVLKWSIFLSISFKHHFNIEILFSTFYKKVRALHVILQLLNSFFESWKTNLNFASSWSILMSRQLFSHQLHHHVGEFLGSNFSITVFISPSHHFIQLQKQQSWEKVRIKIKITSSLLKFSPKLFMTVLNSAQEINLLWKYD